MSSTLTRARLGRQTAEDIPRFLGNAYQRRPVVAVASLALVLLCVAIFTSIYLHAGHKVSVLAVAHNVPQGDAITGGDLTVVRVSLSSGLTPISADQLDHVVGRSAAVSIRKGTLLVASDLTKHGGLFRGSVIVGIAAKSGQLPAGGVAIGDTVEVILTGSPTTLTGGVSDGATATNPSASGAALEIGGILAPDAVVTAVAASTQSTTDTIVVSVEIPSALAPLVATASSAGQAALALTGSNS